MKLKDGINKRFLDDGFWYALVYDDAFDSANFLDDQDDIDMVNEAIDTLEEYHDTVVEEE